MLNHVLKVLFSKTNYLFTIQPGRNFWYKKYTVDDARFDTMEKSSKHLPKRYVKMKINIKFCSRFSRVHGTYSAKESHCNK